MTGKPTIVFCPGLLNDGLLWARQIESLAPDFDCRVFDTALADSVGEMARLLLAEAPGRFSLVGLSMGGYVALEVMRQAPERVERLALLDTNAHADAPAQTENRKRLIALAESGRFSEIPRTLFPNLLHPASLGDAVIVAAMAEMAARVGAQGFVRQQRANMTRPDSRDDLPRIACPVLVLCGEQDALSPVAANRDMARSMPRGKFVAVPDCGHMSPLERPRAVTVALRYWLQET